MKQMTLRAITEAVRGTYHGPEALLDREIAGVTTDSRKVAEEDLFVALRGARSDGHAYVDQVLEKGALCSLVEEPVTEPFIQVGSCMDALREMAHYYRNVLDVKVVGITGSVGKTSTKEAIATVLSEKYNVLKTEGNFNNELGLPLTIFKIREEHEVAVLEMGINHFGEMTRLAYMAQPDYCVITNIGTAHLEFLESRDGILKAKTEMFEFLRPGGIAFLNGDDDKLCTVKEVGGVKPVFFGLNVATECGADGDDAATGCEPDGDDAAAECGLRNRFFATEVENKGLRGTDCVIHGPFEAMKVHVPVPGQHTVYNALAATAVAAELGLSPDEIRHGISEMKALAGRGQIVETDRFLILDDCYNANPVSMRSSLRVVAGTEGRSVAILGDMFELGATEKELHYEVGAYAAELGLDLILTVGELAKEIDRGARDAGASEVYHFDTKNELFVKLPFLLKEKDTILIKASNGMRFNEIVKALWS